MRSMIHILYCIVQTHYQSAAAAHSCFSPLWLLIGAVLQQCLYDSLGDRRTAALLYHCITAGVPLAGKPNVSTVSCWH